MKRILVLCFAILFTLFSGCGANTEQNKLPENSSVEFFAENEQDWDTWSDTWELTDELGRKAPNQSEAGARNGNKQVGIFYLPDVKSIQIAGAADSEAPRNVTEIIKNNENWKYTSGLWGPESSAHYWDEPLYGYYSLLNDEWVIRTHACLLADAGVDFIIIDLTNYYAEGWYFEVFDWSEVVIKIMDVYRKMNEEGQKTPKITALYTWNPSFNGLAINDTYDKFIKDNLDLWYYYEGKPLILGNKDVVREDIKDTFTYRTVSPSYDSLGLWQWCAIFPQSTGQSATSDKEAMAVSSSQNWTDKLSYSSAVDEYGRFISRGRSWTSSSQKLLDDPTSDEYGSEWGYNLQEQFNRAIEVDADLLFITEWNGWINARFTSYNYAGEGFGLPNYANFVDAYSSEFSRTIEPTANSVLKDNTYNQLCENIRWYKGVRTSPNYTVKKSISENNFSDWKSIPSYYRDSLNDKVVRDNLEGCIPRITINNTSGRNDFKQCKVCRDDNYAYFYVECMDDIVKNNNNHWMELYLDTKDNSENSWEGYEYLIDNSNIKGNKSPVKKFTSKLGNSAVVGEAEVYYSGKQMYVKVKLNTLGIDVNNVDVKFKWYDADTTESYKNALDFYTYGDAAPNSRFNYVYTENELKIKPSSMNLYDQTKEVTKSAMSNTDISMASLFTATAPFTAIDLSAYSTYSTPSSFTVSLYEYKTDYDTTIKSKPIMTKTFANIYDRSTLYLGGKFFEAGQYLVLINGVTTSEENTSGLYYYDNQDYNEVFYNGKNIPNTSLKLRIYYYEQANGKSVDCAAYKKGESVTIMLDEQQLITGVCMTPVANKINRFPKAFTIFASEDGENFTLLSRQSYSGFVATPNEQVFSFQDNILKKYKAIKIVFDEDCELSKVTAIIPNTTATI